MTRQMLVAALFVVTACTQANGETDPFEMVKDAGHLAAEARKCGVDVSAFHEKVNEYISITDLDSVDGLDGLRIYLESLVAELADQTSDAAQPCSRVLALFYEHPFWGNDTQANPFDVLKDAGYISAAAYVCGADDVDDFQEYVVNYIGGLDNYASMSEAFRIYLEAAHEGKDVQVNDPARPCD